MLNINFDASFFITSDVLGYKRDTEMSRESVPVFVFTILIKRHLYKWNSFWNGILIQKDMPKFDFGN